MQNLYIPTARMDPMRNSDWAGLTSVAMGSDFMSEGSQDTTFSEATNQSFNEKKMK